MTTWRTLCSLLLILQLAGCAQIAETVQLRAEPLGPPVTVRVDTSAGFAVRGERQGDVVEVQIEAVRYCADEQRQRARGFRVTERHAEGSSLTLEWLFGGLLSATGAGLAAYNAANPPDTSAGSLRSASRGYWFAGGIGAVGLALLGGALAQQLSLGKSETDLGERELKKRGHEAICQRQPATGGQVRLTLADGAQIEATADAQGQASVPLPADLEARMAKEGSRRATLEVLGDARAQVRISL